MKVLLISGGSIDVAAMSEVLCEMHFDKAIAVDGGLEKVAMLQEALGDHVFKLTHIVGDFDTVNAKILSEYQNIRDIEIRAFQPEKDYTDTDIALKLGLELCMNEQPATEQQIVMIGCTGTRLDHTLANLQMLKMAMEAGVDAVILDGHNRIRMIQGRYQMTSCYGKYVSLIPMSPVLKGVTLTGLKYPLNKHDVYLGESLCVSNELTSACAVIEIEEGMALLIESKD